MKWLKDNGDEIETNDLPATVAHCESLGWEKVGDDDEITDKDINDIAKSAYDVTRKASEDDMPTWSKAKKEVTDSVIATVKAVIDNPDFISEGDEAIVSAAREELEKMVK